MAEKSTGQIVLSVVGAVVGFIYGGPSGAALGLSLGGLVGAALDPPKGPHLVGPRLSDLSQQTATYGANIPRLYGNIAVSGNVFWIENNALKEVSTTEGGGKGGGGGAETTTYAYYATFAVGLCEGPIVGVRRIWVGSKLFYDAGSDDQSAIMASNASAELFTLHLGDESQLPDDRMQATLGVANTPAYRGLAYIVFKDLPLKDHGNTLLGAPVKVEVVTEGSVAGYIPTARNISDSRPWYSIRWNGRQFLATAIDTDIFATSPDGIDWTSRPLPRTGVNSWCAAWNGKTWCATTFGNTFLLSKDGIGWRDVTVPNNATWTGIIWDGRRFIAIADSQPWAKSADGLSWDMMAAPASRSWQQIVFIDDLYIAIGSIGNFYAYSKDGNFWGEKYLPSSYNGARLATDGRQIVVFDPYYGQSMATTDGLTWVTRTIPVTLLSSATWDGDNWVLIQNNTTAWRSPDLVVWTSFTVPVYGFIADSAWNGALLCSIGNPLSGMTIKKRSISTVSGSLGAIIEREVLSSNLLDASDIDVTELTQPIRGYRVSSVGAIRSAIEPLQSAFPFDVVQSGYKIKFKPRGSASVATIDATELDARAGNEKPGISIVNAREMDSILPRRVSLKYLDVDREYDIGEQYAERMNTDAINISALDMPLVMTATEAAGNAEMLLYLYWLERYDITFSLPPSYSHLEPGDVITVNATEGTYSLRLTPINYLSDGRLECSAKYNSSAIYSPTAIGEPGLSTGAGLTLPSDTRFALLDIPLLLDATDTPGFPAALCGYLSGWPGGILSRTDDAGQTWTTIQGFTAPGAVIGLASNTIGAGRFDLIDKASALTINLLSGELSSVTEAQMLGGSNHFAYGAHGRWEIIAAQNCVLQGDGSYVLTNLLRGRFGTEWAAGLHTIGDDVILLDSSKVAFITSNLNLIGVARTYRAVTAGGSPSAAEQESFTYAGVNLECLSPVYLNGSRHPSTNDWSMEWVRRTRLGGEWRDYVDATLGEAAETYEVDIFSSNTYSTLKRTLSGLTAPAASYTSAQQMTDFGVVQTEIFVNVYQLSANVGRGYPLSGKIGLPGADLYWGQVVLAMHMDDTGLADLKGKTVTINGGMGRSSAHFAPLTGNAFSALFDGTDDYLSLPSSTDFDYGSGAFTIEFWIYKNNTNPCRALMFGSNGSSDSLQMYFGSDGGGFFRPATAINPAPGVGLYPGSIIPNTWHHIAMVWETASIQKVYVGGVLNNSASGYPWASAARTLTIGVDTSYTPAGYLDGYIDDLRITKGIARYLSNFTPPAAPFIDY